MGALDKLRLGYFDEFPCYEVSHPMVQHKKAEKLAADIEAEYEHRCLMPPLLDTGEPVYIGAEVCTDYGPFVVVQIAFVRGYVILADANGREKWVNPGEVLLTPDSQAKIDADAELTAYEYCKKHGIECDGAERGIQKCKHLIGRQRELNTAEGSYDGER